MKTVETKETKLRNGKRMHRKARKDADVKPSQGTPTSKDFVRKGPNDIKWRTNTTLAPLAGNLPFGFPAGLPFRNVINTINNSVSAHAEIPGIMSIRIQITAGKCVDYNSAFNLAVRKSYSFIRHANSGSKNYEAADLGLYYLAVGQAIAACGWLQRIYRTINKFSSTNRYYPRDLLYMNGLDYDDLKAHQPQLLWLVKWMGNAINGLAFPKMPFFEACYYTFSKYYSDNTSPKEQVYQFVPHRFGIYDPALSSTGGGIDYTQTIATVPTGTNTRWQFGDLEALVYGIMNVLQGDQDVGLISGDILKAYGESGLYKIIGEADTVIEFEHSEEVLQQIHNCAGMPAKFVELTQYKQNAGTLSTAPFVEQTITDPASSTGVAVSLRHFARLFYIDAFSREPDSNEVFNCCVLKNYPSFVPATGQSNYFVDANGCEFGMYWVARTEIAIGVGSNLRVLSKDDQLMPNIGVFPMVYSSDDYLYTSFDWHPILFRGPDSFTSWTPLGDIQNFNIFTIDVLTRIHDTEMLSLFNMTE